MRLQPRDFWALARPRKPPRRQRGRPRRRSRWRRRTSGRDPTARGLRSRRRTSSSRSTARAATASAARPAGSSLAGFDAAKVDDERRGRREDDPQAARRHDAAAGRAASGRRGAARRWSTSLETRIDTAAALNPNPGLASVPAPEPRRVRRARCATCSASTSTSPRSCRPTRSATASTTSPTSQSFSPTLMEGYLRAASQISRLAVGDRNATRDVGHLQDAAHGVADAARRRRADRHARRHLGRAHVPGRRRVRVQGVAALRAARRPLRPQLDDDAATQEQIEVSINGERVALLDINPRMSETDPKNGLELQDAADSHQGRPAARVGRVHPAVRRPGRRPDRAARAHAGRRQHQASASPRCRTCATSTIVGPSASPACPTRRAAARSSPAGRPRRPRKRSCAARDRQEACRRRRIRGAADAPTDLQDAMKFYEQGRKTGDFESRHPHGAAGDPGQPAVPVPPRAGAVNGVATRAGAYRISDHDLASRLSFFLWGTVPDAELIKAAQRRRAADRRPAREAGPADARRPAVRGAVDALRRAVAAAAGPREDHPGLPAVSAVRRHARAGDEAARPSSSSTASCARIAACSTC